jgi:hypothetical protein
MPLLNNDLRPDSTFEEERFCGLKNLTHCKFQEIRFLYFQSIQVDLKML